MPVNLPTPLHMRAAASSHFVLAAIIGLPLAVCLAAAARQPSFWPPTVLWAAFGLLSFFWLRAFQLDVENDRVRYRTLFGGTHELPLADVQSAELEVGRRKYTDRFKPPFRLVLQPKPHAGHRPLTINLKVFRPDDLRRLFDLLNVKPSGRSKPDSLTLTPL